MQNSDQELFHMARVGLGSLGVVTEVTLQCVPAHELVEHTYVATKEQVRREHAQLLRSNKHLRYMWIPYTHDVVVVTNNPLRQVSTSSSSHDDSFHVAIHAMSVYSVSALGCLM